jgi:hypothetical protein
MIVTVQILAGLLLLLLYTTNIGLSRELTLLYKTAVCNAMPMAMPIHQIHALAAMPQNTTIPIIQTTNLPISLQIVHHAIVNLLGHHLIGTTMVCIFQYTVGNMKVYGILVLNVIQIQITILYLLASLATSKMRQMMIIKVFLDTNTIAMLA